MDELTKIRLLIKEASKWSGAPGVTPTMNRMADPARAAARPGTIQDRALDLKSKLQNLNFSRSSAPTPQPAQRPRPQAMAQIPAKASPPRPQPQVPAKPQAAPASQPQMTSTAPVQVTPPTITGKDSMSVIEDKTNKYYNELKARDQGKPVNIEGLKNTFGQSKSLVPSGYTNPNHPVSPEPVTKGMKNFVRTDGFRAYDEAYNAALRGYPGWKRPASPFTSDNMRLMGAMSKELSLHDPAAAERRRRALVPLP